MYVLNKVCWMGLLLIVASGCVETQTERLRDQPIAAFQAELLDEAFAFATAIPLEPHIKDRAHYQELVVDSALELDQPSRALKYAGQIPNWRRGRAYADYAFYCVGLGYTNEVASLLEKADIAARGATQDWRRERVLVRVAQTWRAMGDMEKAAQYGNSLKQTESGSAALQKSMRCTEAEFDEYSRKLDLQLDTGDLDLKDSALYAYAALYDQFYDNASRRALIEEKIESGWDKIPYFNRIDLLGSLIDSALKHDNGAEAARLAGKARGIVNSLEWPAEYHIKVLARIANLEIKCGQREAALRELLEAQEIFNAKKADIINIYRTEALLPVAEAYALAGDAANAQKIYAQAVEQAVVNTNSRPRAEDLCQILLSMATHGMQPDAVLWKRINEIKSGLGDPW